MILASIEMPKIPSNRDHRALNRGTSAHVGVRDLWSPTPSLKHGCRMIGAGVRSCSTLLYCRFINTPYSCYGPMFLII